jgi:hypothetical protein
MKIIIKNTVEAQEYINEIKGRLIAELLFSQLMKEPEQIRLRLYEKLIHGDNSFQEFKICHEDEKQVREDQA